MDVCAKRGGSFTGFTGILLPRGNEIHYIGGTEVSACTPSHRGGGSQARESCREKTVRRQRPV